MLGALICMLHGRVSTATTAGMFVGVGKFQRQLSDAELKRRHLVLEICHPSV